MPTFKSLINDALKKKISDKTPRSDVIAKIAKAAKREESTINQIMNGSIKNPDVKVRAAIGRVLGLSANQMERALRLAHIDPGAAQNKKFAEVRSVKIFEADTPQSGDITEAGLKEVVENFEKLKTLPASGHEPPVVLSHDETQPFLKADSLPAAGWPTRLWQEGKQLYADISNVPNLVAAALDKKAFRKCSVEIYNDYVDGMGNHHGKALRRIALCGGAIPRIRGLSDWLALDEAPAEAFSEGSPVYEVILYEESLADSVQRDESFGRLNRIWWKANDRMYEIRNSELLSDEEKKSKLETVFSEMITLLEEAGTEAVASFSERAGDNPMADEATTTSGDAGVKTYTEEDIQAMRKQFETQNKETAERLARIEAERRRERAVHYCERIKAEGLAPSIADDACFLAFLEQLSDEPVQAFAEGDAKQAPRTWFEGFMEGVISKARKGKLLIDFSERSGEISASGAAPGSDDETAIDQQVRKYAEENKVSYAQAVIAVSEAAG